MKTIFVFCGKVSYTNQLELLQFLVRANLPLSRPASFWGQKLELNIH
jgi:hypothetical protein